MQAVTLAPLWELRRPRDVPQRCPRLGGLAVVGVDGKGRVHTHSEALLRRMQRLASGVGARVPHDHDLRAGARKASDQQVPGGAGGEAGARGLAPGSRTC